MITAFIITTVLLVLGIGYLIWTRSSTAQLTAGPGVQPGVNTAPIAGGSYAESPQVASAPASPSLRAGIGNALDPRNAAQNALGTTRAATSAGLGAIKDAAKNPVSLLNPVTGIKVALASPVAVVKNIFKF